MLARSALGVTASANSFGSVVACGSDAVALGAIETGATACTTLAVARGVSGNESIAAAPTKLARPSATIVRGLLPVISEMRLRRLCGNERPVNR
jgi:hypothetical protein